MHSSSPAPPTKKFIKTGHVIKYLFSHTATVSYIYWQWKTAQVYRETFLSLQFFFCLPFSLHLMANPDSGELVVSCTARDSLQFALQRRFFVFDYSLFSSDRYIFLAFSYICLSSTFPSFLQNVKPISTTGSLGWKFNEKRNNKETLCLFSPRRLLCDVNRC